MEPIEDVEVTLVARRYAQAVTRLELEPGEPLLVLPNGDFFPDTFRGDRDSLDALIARLSGYAGLEVEVSARLSGDDEACDTGAGAGCGSGGCAPSPAQGGGMTRPLRDERGWSIDVARGDLANPMVLTSRLAASIAAVCLAQQLEEGENVSLEQAELAAVALGFGVLTLESSHVYQKGCGGPRVGRATALDCRSLAIALCLFLSREKLSPRAARSELSATQAELVGQAWEVIDSSPSLVTSLRSHPERIVAGDFNLRDGGSWLGRVFGKLAGRQNREARALAALERGASVDEVAALLGQGARGQSARSD